MQGPIYRGGCGFNPPNDFFGPPSLRRFELLVESILTPVLVLHVSACGASSLLPDGDPPPMFFFTNRSLQACCFQSEIPRGSGVRREFQYFFEISPTDRLYGICFLQGARPGRTRGWIFTVYGSYDVFRPIGNPCPYTVSLKY